MRYIIFLTLSFTLLGAASVFAEIDNERALYKTAKRNFDESKFEQAIDSFRTYMTKYGIQGRYADRALYFLGESYTSLLKEYQRMCESLDSKTSSEIKKAIGTALYNSLWQKSIERNSEMGITEEFLAKNPGQVEFGIRRLYAEKIFFDRYSKYKCFQKLDFEFRGPFYNNKEYEELMKNFPKSRFAKNAFLRLAHASLELQKHPMANFEFVDYEGFGSFIGVLLRCVGLYEKYKIDEGLAACLERINRMYLTAIAVGGIEDVNELEEVKELFERMIKAVPESAPAFEAQAIVKDLEHRIQELKSKGK